ncbi:c-type cytochrome [bacterium]|nr:c-type cytochrome [bacterium]
MPMFNRILVLALILFSPCVLEAADLKLLFLGDNGHHRPAKLAELLVPVLEKHGIEIRYTDDAETALSSDTLKQFDGLIVYANIDVISDSQAKALLDYVASGHGFIPLHCASYCFRNNDDVVALIGAQFQRHGMGVFRVHPTEAAATILIMRGYGGFESWDETYVHTKHNEENRTVLEHRLEGDEHEPWTWTKTYGKGRVFYTAWGHDERTWSNPGFQNLVERGIRWACGDDPAKAGPYVDPDYFDVPAMTQIAKDVKPFEYLEVGPKIPNYTPSDRWGVQGKPMTQMQKPLPAEESLKHYSVPQGFELKLFADETQLASKPISMNWDERGRLWLCETVDYPNELAKDNRGHDKVEIAEDTDGDGKADKFTVFAEHLSIPTAILPFGDACIVQNGTETLYLADTNGDGKSDVHEVLISNWELGDTHGGVSNFRLGIDNWVYAMQGYNNSTPMIDGKPQQSFRMGFWRFRLEDGKNGVPHVAEIEFLRSTDNNTWGLGISEEGLIFGSTANHNPSCFMPIANRYYERVRGWGPEVLHTIADTYRFKPVTDKIRQVDQHGGYTAGCGHALYTARNYPQQWWNRTAFVCGPTGKLVGTFVLKRDGAGYRSTSPMNLVASDDEWAAPIMAEVGPDGNVWILDWYNFVVQHNPTPQGFETGKGNAYESDLRDKRHGRIYRLVYRGDAATANAAYRPVKLHKASAEGLVAALQDPTLVVRQNAQRLLVQRGKMDVVPALIKLVADQSVDAIGLNVGAIHAIWTLHGLGQIDEAHYPVLNAVTKALMHPSAGVRRNAIQTLPQTNAATRLLYLTGVLKDRDAQVRLAAILALADQPEHPKAGSVIADLVRDADYSSDRWIADSLTSAAAMHAVPFLASLADAGAGQGGGLGGTALPTADIVAEHIARSRPTADAVITLVASLEKADPQLTQTVLAGLNRGWPRDHSISLSAEQDQTLVALLNSVPDAAKGLLVRLSSQWGSKELKKHVGEIVKALFKTAEDDDAKLDDRLAAVSQIVELQSDDDDVVSELLDLVTPQAAPEFSTGLLSRLTGSNAEGLGMELVARSKTMSPSIRQAALRTLLARPQTTKDFLTGVESGMVQLADLSLDQKQALGRHPNREIRERALKLLSMGGGLPNADRQKVVEELLPLTKVTGNVEAGLAMFKKHCMKCHKHGEIGEKIGPNLTGMAVHPKAELLVHMMDPSRSVEGNFRLYTVILADGLILNGMLASETRTSIELIDAEAKRHSIQREDIDELVASSKSLMPEGFEKQMSKEELTNLLEFLTDKGPYLPLDVQKVATYSSGRGMFFNPDNREEQVLFDDWKPKVFHDVPFVVVDPDGGKVRNVIYLYGPNGGVAPSMPRDVKMPINSAAKAIHLLSGISGWGFPFHREKSLTVTVRLHYADGKTEDHELRNGVHFADYIRHVDVPESEFAFGLQRGRQCRYLVVKPNREEVIKEIEFVKGDDIASPIIFAVTVETLR